MTIETGLTATDMFCGAGGSSIGIKAVGGRLKMAANHWQLAVDTHQANFPDADHDTADLSQVDPRRFPRTDVLWASPECTNHSQAKGKKRATGQGDLFGAAPDPAAERSRATMWDVVRFAEYHRYAAIIVENVVDVAQWELWGPWRMSLEALGYQLQVVSLNSAHTDGEGGVLAAPQSRDRVYVVCTRKGTTIDLELRPTIWCPRCSALVAGRQAWKPGRTIGRYRQQYVYACSTCGTHGEPLVRPAAAAIDWDLIGERIGDRARPLKPATIRRIEAGLRKYGRPTPPMVFPVTRSQADKTPATLDGPLATQTARQDVAMVLPPMLVPSGGTRNEDAVPVDGPMRTRTTTEAEALCVPPFLDPMREGPRPIPMHGLFATMVAGNQSGGGNHILIEPPGSFIAELRGGGSEARSTSEPLATVTASGTHHALVIPEAAWLMRNNTARGNPAQMVTPVGEPARTITTAGHQSLIVLPPHLIVDYYRNGSVRSVAEPVGTVTTLDRHALLDPADLVDDCLFRMLAPHEIGAAMAFPSTYTVLGSKRDKVRMYGNAVTPPASALLWSRVVEALGAAA